jgi:hypothetical protein
MKDEEKREIAEQNYLVKRKIKYIKNSSEIDKKLTFFWFRMKFSKQTV